MPVGCVTVLVLEFKEPVTAGLAADGKEAMLEEESYACGAAAVQHGHDTNLQGLGHWLLPRVHLW